MLLTVKVNISTFLAGKITLYRAGNHVDISKGPMIGTTGQIGRITVSSVHKLIGK